MGIFDALTGAAGAKAAKNNAYAIQTGMNQANTALGDNYGTANNILANSALPALGAGYAQARSDIGGQYGATQGYLDQQGNLYDHMAQGGQSAYDAYLNATGANGAAGSAAATAAFQSAPGYQYQQDQALDAVQRSAAARGGLAGGNATADILKTATGLADQSYQQYVSNLGNAASSYGTALGGQASSLGAQATASQNYGTQLGSLGTGLGAGQASIYGQQATNLTNLGNANAAVIGNATNAYVGNNNQLAKSETAASDNFLGLLGGGAKLLSGSLGSSGGLSKLFS
jgi:hypothetical protein